MLLVLAVGSNACFEPPQFPSVPVITFNNIVFKNYSSTTPGDDDTLMLTINFKDGDGDLGLDASNPGDAEGIYAPQYYFLADGTKVFLTGTSITNPAYFQLPDGTLVLDSLISYRTKRKALGKANDTLPAYVPPFSCTNWSIITKLDSNSNSQVPVDTLYMQLNPNYYNIFVDVLVKQNDGSFVAYNGNLNNDCSAGLDGRFPILASDPSKPGPLEGTIRYSMASLGWLVTFSTKTLELRVSIQDRALHRSNTIITPPFALK